MIRYNRIISLLLLVFAVSACGFFGGNQKTPGGYVRHCVRLLDREALFADSPEWLEEAAKRGLKAHTVTAEAFKEYLTPESVALFTSHKVLNQAELEARYEIKTETLLKKIQIESRVIVDMASNHIIPTAIKYQNLLIDNVRGIKEIFPDKVREYAAKEIETLAEIAALTNKINEAAVAMTDIRRRLNKIESIPERALRYEQEVGPNMISLRKCIDDLEMIVDDDFWPLVKYREILAAL